MKKDAVSTQSTGAIFTSQNKIRWPNMVYNALIVTSNLRYVREQLRDVENIQTNRVCLSG